MEFRIADTFTASLARLSGEEQKAVKTTAFDLQINPNSPGMSFHKLDKARDKKFWSLRVTRDIRLIVHRSQDSLLLCYVDHHDKAYDWAERRKLETHPQTGAAQLVEIRETVQETFVAPPVAPAPRSAAVLFNRASDEQLLQYGVPAEWLGDVRRATEETLLVLIEHLPAEAAEALLELATGGKPHVPRAMPAISNPFDHPDAQRRFRVMPNLEELQRALDAPWETWTVFLHPEQRQLVQREYSGPARVSGSAGTGKTIVALHRAVFLARSNANSRVLLTTFGDTLAHALRAKMRLLVSEEHEPKLAERIDVYGINAIGLRLYKARIGPPQLAPEATIRTLLQQAWAAGSSHFSLRFLESEWEQVVDAWQLDSWEAYRDVARLGRKTRLAEAQRAQLWAMLDQVRIGLAERKLLTYAGLFTQLAAALSASPNNLPFEHIVVDEAQDISIAHLRFLAALSGERANGLFLAGDLGQRIFQQPFSWKQLGVDIRGRSATLRVNYRTSHQIRMQADRLLATSVADLDGNTIERGDTISVFNGPAPTVRTLANNDEERDTVAAWLTEQTKAGLLPQEFGVFVRSTDELARAQAAVAQTGLPFNILDTHVATTNGFVTISTMHLAKGLEFKAVIVMACDDNIIPSQPRIAAVGDISDLEEVYSTERHLLYVACTRARDALLITSVAPASEFLDDLQV